MQGHILKASLGNLHVWMATDKIIPNQEIWHDSSSVERRYEHWSSRLNSILHKCFPKKRLISNKQIYTKEIRRYISERKEVKKKLSRTSGISETGQQYLSHKIRRLDKVIDDKISDFNHQVIRGKVSEDGTISKQDFWKIKKKRLFPKVLK